MDFFKRCYFPEISSRFSEIFKEHVAPSCEQLHHNSTLYDHLEVNIAHCTKFWKFIPDHTNSLSFYEFVSPLFLAVAVVYIPSCCGALIRSSSTAISTVATKLPISSWRTEYFAVTLPLAVALLCSAHSALQFIVPSVIIGCVALKAFCNWPQIVERLKLPTTAENGRLEFLDRLRGHVTLLVCLAIMAVDFLGFSRQLAKSEDYGCTLMDTGVGATIMSAGLVAKNAASASFADILSKFAVVWVIGIGTFIVKYALSYQVPVTEYGVHWNFLLTLGVVTFVSHALLKYIIRPGWAWLASVIMLIVGQYCMSTYNIEDYILNAPRLGFFGANREGIISCWGFTALYLFWVSVGHFTRKHSHRVSAATLIAISTLGCFALLFMAFFISNHFSALPSRRWANMTYALVCSSEFFWLMGIEMFATCVEPTPGIITRIFSANQLYVFLLANVCTGLVRMSMKTILVSPAIGLAVNAGYLAVLSYVFVLYRGRPTGTVKKSE